MTKRTALFVMLAGVFICTLSLCGPARADAVWTPLVDRLVADGFDRAYVESIYGKDVEYSPDIMARKMSALLETKLRIKKTGAPRKPEVMDRYLNPILIAGAYSFYREHSGDFAKIEARYGVPGTVLTALMLVETKLGLQVGKHNAVTILSNMALANDVDMIRPYIKRKVIPEDVLPWFAKRTLQKSNWGYAELKSLLEYARKNGHDPTDIPSSMYGAIGLCQFIPSSAVHYGVDGTGNGSIDLFETTDALYSMANFVKKHGWKPGLDRDAQLKVIYRYNHSESYALTIMAVADKIKSTANFFGN